MRRFNPDVSEIVSCGVLFLKKISAVEALPRCYVAVFEQSPGLGPFWDLLGVAWAFLGSQRRLTRPVGPVFGPRALVIFCPGLSRVISGPSSAFANHKALRVILRASLAACLGWSMRCGRLFRGSCASWLRDRHNVGRRNLFTAQSWEMSPMGGRGFFADETTTNSVCSCTVGASVQRAIVC